MTKFNIHLIKTLQKVSIERTHMTKAHRMSPQLIAYLVVERRKNFLSGQEQARNKTTLIQCRLEVLATAVRQEKEIKNPDWKGTSKIVTVGR